MKQRNRLLATFGCVIFVASAMAVDELCCESDEPTIESDELTIEEVRKRKNELLAQAMPDLHRQMVDGVWESRDGFSKFEVIVTNTTSAWNASSREMKDHSEAMDLLRTSMNLFVEPNSVNPTLGDPLEVARWQIVTHVVHMESTRQLWAKTEDFLLTELETIVPEKVPDFRECFKDNLVRAESKSLRTQSVFLKRISNNQEQSSLLNGIKQETRRLSNSLLGHRTAYRSDIQHCLSEIQSQIDIVVGED